MPRKVDKVDKRRKADERSKAGQISQWRKVDKVDKAGRPASENVAMALMRRHARHGLQP